ncbi:hypothetical protein JMJ55_17185 [Belnapia sp. T6]|uniref:Uncharacterized protein n=1 Tax=Belnapia mucosa TaxID=2804532 RepID=A0ABS1V9R0_9PROT|nr:hypothetical protein [Belnapia mucosa]MBL6457073.1 hypothetical protein [Belnapia mucosa]
MPEKPRSDLIALLALIVILGVLVGGYLIFPSLQRAMGYTDCIASGRVTGC